MLPTTLLVLCLVTLWWFVRNDAADYAAFKKLRETILRQKRYRAWIAKSFLVFSGTTLVALAFLGRLGALIVLPHEFTSLSRSVRVALPIHHLPVAGFLAGLIGAMLVGVLGGLLAAKRHKGLRKPVVIGDITPLMPRNGLETIHTAVLSVNAGISEEVFFRLLLPLLLTMIFGDTVVAFAVAAIAFGVVHLYQGWIGVFVTMIMGFVFATIYLGTGSLWIAVGAHALLDLFGLVVRPTFDRCFVSVSPASR